MPAISIRSQPNRSAARRRLTSSRATKKLPSPAPRAMHRDESLRRRRLAAASRLAAAKRRGRWAGKDQVPAGAQHPGDLGRRRATIELGDEIEEVVGVGEGAAACRP